MKNEVTVNGVKLTRAQVEQAMKDLDSLPQFKPGDIVRNDTGDVGIVLSPGGHNDRIFSRQYGEVSLRIVNSLISWSPVKLENWTKVGSLDDFKFKE